MNCGGDNNIGEILCQSIRSLVNANCSIEKYKYDFWCYFRARHVQAEIQEVKLNSIHQKTTKQLKERS
jgi:hypothetical protein